MSTDYLPSTDAGVKEFAENFDTKVTAAPADYGLVANDATAINAVVQAYTEKYVLATAPDTRTKAAINNKNVAKANAIAVLRAYGMQIKSNRAVSDDAKIRLGLGIYNKMPTPVPAPSTFPIISLQSINLRSHELRFRDAEAGDDTLGKPEGVVGLQFFCHIGDAPLADPLKSPFQAVLTRCRLTMHFTTEDLGKTAYYIARWQSGRGLVGPWSQVLTAPIAG